MWKPRARAAVTRPGLSSNSSSRALRGGGQRRARAQASCNRGRAQGQGAITSSSRGASPTARAAATRVSSSVVPTSWGQGRARTLAQEAAPRFGKGCQCSRPRGCTPMARASQTSRGMITTRARTISPPRRPKLSGRGALPWSRCPAPESGVKGVEGRGPGRAGFGLASPGPAGAHAARALPEPDPCAAPGSSRGLPEDGLPRPRRRGINQRRLRPPRPVSRSSITASSSQRPVQSS